MTAEHESQETGRTSALEDRRQALLRTSEKFADEVAHRPDNGNISAPVRDIETMFSLGFLTAPLPLEHGGLALFEPEAQETHLRLLAAIGSADLVLGRLFEGHMNALLLLGAFASAEQQASAYADAHKGLLFGVWNTGAQKALQVSPAQDGFVLSGVKTFASGAALVQRPVVTADLPGRGWQMMLLRMETPEVADSLKLRREFWEPLGMEASESFEVDFTGARLGAQDLFGLPGDFYRDPLFRGGATRFASVHAGAIIRLQRSFAEWLRDQGRDRDPYQLARLAETSLLARSAALWVERAADESRLSLFEDAPKHAAERMVEFANAMRIAIERVGTEIMQHVTAGVGARGLLRPQRFGRLIRDLTMYLRQPAPDETLAEVGRAALRNLSLRPAGAAYGIWRQDNDASSLPASYFDGVYAASDDPWEFETSSYESKKYRTTVESLPRERYANALEIGCSIGVLTRQLAERCDRLLGVDVSEKALSLARQRCADLSQVHFSQCKLPDQMPEGEYDLVLLSEVGYYWSYEDLDRAATCIADRQPTGGTLLLVHFTEVVPDYPLTGDQVHDFWLKRPEWKPVRGMRCERYRLDLLERL